MNNLIRIKQRSIPGHLAPQPSAIDWWLENDTFSLLTSHIKDLPFLELFSVVHETISSEFVGKNIARTRVVTVSIHS